MKTLQAQDDFPLDAKTGSCSLTAPKRTLMGMLKGME